jgi:hypothetical protein
MVVRNAELFGALRAVLANADSIWLALGTVNVYLTLVRQVGLSTARQWSLLIVAAAWLTAALSVWVALPLGPVRFTGRRGFMVGPVSIGWVLLFYCCVVGAREFVRALAGTVSHGMTSVMTGALLGVVSIPLEIVGWKLRAWWIWYPGQATVPVLPPTSGFLAWALIGALLALVMRERRIVSEATLGRPTVVFLCIVALLGIALGTASS